MCLSHANNLHRPTCLAHRRYLGSVKKKLAWNMFSIFSSPDFVEVYRSILSSTDPWVTLTGPKSFYSIVQQCYPAESTKLPLKWTKCLDADPNNHILYHQSNSNLTNHFWIWSLQNTCPPCWPQAIPGQYIHNKMWTCKPCFYRAWITTTIFHHPSWWGESWVPQQWKKHS